MWLLAVVVVTGLGVALADTGVEACSPCHAEIAASYAATGMGRSFYRAEPARMNEDFRVRNRLEHSLSERSYLLVERDGRYYQRRYQIGAEGAVTNVIEKEIHYVMGSGNHSRAYLHLNAAGELIQLPAG
jgi:hypothetical protein